MKTKRQIIKEKIAKANKHHEAFRRHESWRYGRLSRSTWRRPQGKDIKMRWVSRRGTKGGLPSSPSPGFRTPNDIRGLHPSGYEPIVIHSEGELVALKPKYHAIIIGSSVGNKKRITLKEAILSRGFKLLNPGIKSKEIGAAEAGEFAPSDVDTTVGKVKREIDADIEPKKSKIELSADDLKDVEADVEKQDKGDEE